MVHVPDPDLLQFAVTHSHGLLNKVYCQNLVVTVNICNLTKGDILDKDVLRAIGAKCNLSLFHAVSLRVKPGCTVLIFATGKVIISGSKSIEDMDCGGLVAQHILNSMRIGNFHIKDRRITNIVGTAYLPTDHFLDFEAINTSIPLKCMEADQFAGMFVTMPELKTNFILFESGAIVVCSRSEELMTRAVTRMEVIILRSNAVRVASGVKGKAAPALAEYIRRQREAERPQGATYGMPFQ